MSPNDRAHIEELLQDESLSFREISRRTGFSDWTIRNIARQLDGDSRPMKQRAARWDESPEVSPVAGWAVTGALVGAVVLAIWAAVRWTPPKR